MICGSPIQSPESEIQRFVDCANVLLRERQKVQFEIVRYESVLKGTFLEKFVVIKLKPI